MLFLSALNIIGLLKHGEFHEKFVIATLKV
jgi:hypothetical protein